MATVKDYGDSLAYPYKVKKLKEDQGPLHIYPVDFLTNPEYEQARLDLDIHRVIDNPPTLGPYERVQRRYVERVGNFREAGTQYHVRYVVVTVASELHGGTREPTSQELDELPEQAAAYYRRKVGQYLNIAAGERPLPFGNDKEVRGGTVFEPDINNVTAYCDFDNFLRAEAEQLRLWRSQVWATALTLMRTWEAGGRINSPTWAEIEVQLPDPPAPPPELVQ